MEPERKDISRGGVQDMSANVTTTPEAAISKKMQEEGYVDYQIREALSNYNKAYASSENEDVSREKGKIYADQIEPADNIPTVEELSEADIQAGKEAISNGKIVVINLVGGLGTSMGLDEAKVLGEVKPGISFLDIIQMQANSLGKEAEVPFLFMTSRHTDSDIKAKLAIKPVWGIEPTFVQAEVPRIVQDTRMPLECGDISKEMCPPGHGAIYSELFSKKILRELVQRGVKAVFISNGDNLGATVDPAIIGYFIRSGAPFMMEVTRRTDADKKGGHLCIDKKTGGYMLRESAQCPSDAASKDDFQNVNKYKAFNTNSIYIDPAQVLDYMEKHDDRIDLPVMINSKDVVTNEGVVKVHQHETAMGAALGVLPGSIVIEVSRKRFFPVKKTCDLLILRSDIMKLEESGNMVVAAGDSGISVELGEHYTKVKDFDKRFSGTVSLKDCSGLSVKGDIYFKDVTFRGKVKLENESGRTVEVSSGAIISGKVTIDKTGSLVLGDGASFEGEYLVK